MLQFQASTSAVSFRNPFESRHKPVRLKLSGRMTLSLVGVTLLGLACATALSQIFFGRLVDSLLLNERFGSFSTEVTDYYQQHGSLNGIDALFRARPADRPGSAVPPARGAAAQRAPAGPPPVEGPAGSPAPDGVVAFGLADETGTVVLASPGYTLTQQLSQNALSGALPIRFKGAVIGWALLPDTPFPWSETESAYVNATRTALGLAAVGGIVVAAAVGTWLARTISGPVRQLTAAAIQVSGGERAEVPVVGDDELAELARAFNRMSADLDHAQKARRQMTADIAHELRNPLTTITGYVQAIRDGELAPTKERLDAVFDQAQRLGSIIEDLRTLTLADIGALSLTFRSLNPLEVLRATAQNYAVQASQRGVAIRCDAPAPLREIQGDPQRLNQVFGNLVANAIRHTGAGGEVRLTGREDDSSVLLAVQDTGEGIAPEELPYIFDRFFRAGAPARRDGSGSGLGLAIVKALITAHEGTIEANSQPGAGTTMTIRLPKARVATG